MLTQSDRAASAIGPPLDESVLAVLLEQLDPTATGLRAVLLSGFLDDAAAQVERMQVASSAGDLAAVASAAHTLRSTSALIGGLPLAGLLRSAEDAAGAGPDRLPELLVRIRGEHERLATAVRRLLGATPPG